MGYRRHAACMPAGIENCSITTMSQRSFASAEYSMKKKRTRREKFLADMERVVGPPGRGDRAAVPDERTGRKSAHRCCPDAAYVLPSAVVRAGRRGTRRRAV